MKHIFYFIASDDIRIQPKRLPEGLKFVQWRPSLMNVKPPGLPGCSFFVWWIFHLLHVFSNRDYSMAVVYNGNKVVHRTGVFPRYFRFPFMGNEDLQIGDVWTHEQYRNRGIASFVVENILNSSKKPGRFFWYVTATENPHSLKLAERSGMIKRGEGIRTSCFGLKLFGAFVLNKSTS